MSAKWTGAEFEAWLRQHRILMFGLAIGLAMMALYLAGWLLLFLGSLILGGDPL